MVFAKCIKNPPEKSENNHYQPAKINKKRPPQPRQPFPIVKNFSRCNRLLGETHGASLTDDGDLNLTRIGHFGLDFL